MNKDLKDKIFKLPDNILTFLKSQFKNKPDDVDGTKRNQELINTGYVTYHQIKHIIRDLKNIDKNKDIGRYNMYGGELMQKWAETTLNNERDFIKDNKYAKKQSDNISAITGERKNAFLKTHSKKSSMLPPINQIKSNSNKNSVSSLKLGKLFEEILKR